MANLARAASLNAILLAMVPDAKPPRTLRYRLLASIGFERARWGWVGALATALMVAGRDGAAWFSKAELAQYGCWVVDRHQETTWSVRWPEALSNRK